MGEEYVLPSGLAKCLYYNEFTGASECVVPSNARRRNEALAEALQQLHKLTRLNKQLENDLLFAVEQLLLNDSSQDFNRILLLRGKYLEKKTD